jgi:murein DD-endopeptidase MepM/ murein hydrolase activator NlpD
LLLAKAALALGLLLGALAVGSVLAKQIYRWTDVNGVVHFSDTPPADKKAAQNLSARLIDVDPQDPVRLRQDQKPGEIGYFAYNDLAGPVSIAFELSDARSISTEPALPLLITLTAKREQAAFVVKATGADGRYSLRYRWTPGDPNAVPDPNASYRLPFRAGQVFAVHQAFGGSFSHNTPDSQYAVDFAMPKGTDVLAARAGVVMQVQDDFFRNGTDLSKYGERANVVVIVHSDGTLAVYAHLDLESVIVGVGRRVEAGQLIGKSGNTGFSTGPHLHFVIQHNDRGTLKSLPFAFTIEGKLVTPTVGAVLGG